MFIKFAYIYVIFTVLAMAIPFGCCLCSEISQVFTPYAWKGFWDDYKDEEVPDNYWDS